jgi:hypothetical protein
MTIQKHQAPSWQGLLLADGRYQLGAALGAGGMAQVYRAHDRRLDSDVVVKVPHPTLLLQPGFAARFSLEIRSLVRLSHPNVVRVLDVGEQDGIPFAVLQYLPGGSLRDRFPRTAPLDSLSTWLEPIAAALDFIHGKGYLHRDIKPDNILFDEHGNAYLSDFGIAKALADDGSGQRQTLTGTGMVLGTPQYMAPELLLGQPCDGRVDQYALAITVYELLGGRPPHDGPTPAAIFVAQTTKPAPPLSKLCPTLPASVVSAVQRGLARDAGKRYPTCVAFARAVLASKASAPSAAEPGEATACPKCGAVFHLPERVRGKQVRCRACQAVFRAPERAPVAARAPVVSAETVPGLQADPRTVPVTSGKRPAAAAAAGASRRRALPLLVAAILLIAAGIIGLSGWLVLRRQGPAGSTAATALSQPEWVKLQGHTDGVTSVALSPDGTRLASASRDLTVRVWDTLTGKQAHSLEGHSEWVRSVCWSPDGKRLASAAADQTVRIWDATKGEELHTLKGHKEWVRSVCFSPDGKHLASGGDDNLVLLWDPVNGQQALSFEGNTSRVTSVCYSPDCSRLASAGADQIIRIWEASTYQEVQSLRGHKDWVTSVCFSSDGKRLASAGEDQTVRIWDAARSEELFTLRGHRSWVTSVCFSSDGKRLASAGEDKTVRIWDAQSGQQVLSFEGHTDWVTSVCFSPDGRYCVSGSADKTIRLWKLPD